MKRGRAYEEARKLGERYPVAYSEADRRVVLERFDFPPGWDPQFSKLRYELPDTYPRDMPTVYVPSELSYEGKSPTHLLHGISPYGDSDWSKWCIEDHNVNWDPGSDTLVKLTTMMRASLANPYSDNPFAGGSA
ncbi:hypothetical protein [Haloglomus litoreum]|uniref:hypothetical protein n=1 Tax=Haloglomus litoreum TaxID=3034026 RepID=UPI0023E77A00|nr:hypothetical protein [Haloglomus sp. DT116]